MEILQEIKSSQFDKILINNQTDEMEKILSKLEELYEETGPEISSSNQSFISSVCSIEEKGFISNFSHEEKNNDRRAPLHKILELKSKLNKILIKSTLKIENYNKLKTKIQYLKRKFKENKTKRSLISDEILDKFELIINRIDDIDDLVVPVIFCLILKIKNKYIK